MTNIDIALANVASFREALNDPHDFDEAIAALRVATEPAALDYQNGARFALKVKAGTDLNLVREALRPGDIAWEEGGAILEVTAAGTLAPSTQHDDKPSTPYGVRIYYDDQTMEEIHDIIGVQVANLIDGSFPVGFMQVEDSEDDAPVPGRWTSEGEFLAFDAPKERPGW